MGAHDIVDGSARLSLGLVWTIILRFQVRCGRGKFNGMTQESNVKDFNTTSNDKSNHILDRSCFFKEAALQTFHSSTSAQAGYDTFKSFSVFAKQRKPSACADPPPLPCCFETEAWPL